MMNKINILWTTDNKDTIFNMLSMYVINAKKKDLWNNVNVIMWGASVKLARNDKQVQTEILEMLNNGVFIEAYQTCCENFDAVEILSKCGVKVRSMGVPLTEYIKAGEYIITI